MANLSQYQKVICTLQIYHNVKMLYVHGKFITMSECNKYMANLSQWQNVICTGETYCNIIML